MLRCVWILLFFCAFAVQNFCMAHNPSADEHSVDALKMLLEKGTLTNDEYHLLTARISSIGTSRKLMEEGGAITPPTTYEEEPSTTGKTAGLIIAPVASFILLGIFGYAGIRLTGDLAADIVEEMSEGMDFKQFVQNTLANVGIVSALILSIVISMMQIGKPDGLSVPSAICWEVYVAMCFLAAGFSIQGVVTSAFGIMYFSQMSEIENKKMFVCHPETIGFPISCMAVCSMLLILEAIMYVSIVGIPTMAIYTTLAGLICFYNCISGWLILSRYKNSEIKDETREHRKSFLRGGTVLGWSQVAYDIAFRGSTAGTISANSLDCAKVREQALSALPGPAISAQDYPWHVRPTPHYQIR